MSAAWQVDQLAFDTNESISYSHDFLQLLRSSLLRRPWAVLQNGRRVLKGYGSKSEEYWEAAADMCRAALEVGELATARRILDRIGDKFGTARVRVKLLSGQLLESQGRSSQAMDVYIQTISEAPLSPVAYKRQVAVLKSDMKWNEAIALLNYYLTIYGDDVEAWAELCALALRVARFAHALFAASELVAQDGSNYAHHLLLADVYMTCTRTVQNVSSAHQHYVASAGIRTRGNLRALYGVWLTSSLLLLPSSDTNNSNISNEGCNDAASTERLTKTHAHSKKAIVAVYQSEPCAHTDHSHVNRMLENYQTSQ